MCQLIATNLGTKKLNITAVQLLAWEGARANDDGFGVCCAGNWNKTDIAADKTLDLGTFISDSVLSASPVLAHIRAASSGIPVTVENAHPFESDNFILFHNGSLVVAGEKKKYNNYVAKNETPPESDSLKFLNSLEDEYKKDKDFVKAFNDAMGGYWGKFAFLIYNKKTRENIAIRGKTAPLYICYLLDNDQNSVGWMVNTSKLNLDKVSFVLANIAQVWESRDLSFSDPEEIPINTINLLDKDGGKFEKIADCRENEEKDVAPEKESLVKRASRALIGDGKNQNSNRRPTYSPLFGGDQLKEEDPMFTICKYMVDHKFMPKDMIAIFKLFLGVDMASANDLLIQRFADDVIPRITAYPSFLRGVQNTLEMGVFPSVLYGDDYELEYPWPINNEQVVFAALKRYNKETKRSK